MSRSVRPRGAHVPPAPTPVAAWRSLLTLVLPVVCGGCGAPDVPLCDPCARSLPTGGTWVGVPGGPDTWSGGDYTGALRQLVLASKDDGRHDLRPVLARCLGGAVEAALLATAAPQTTWLVPVPSSRRAVRRRGADVTAELARGAAVWLRRRDWAVAVLPVLRQRRGVHDQAGLSAAARSANLTDGVLLRRGAVVRGRPVLVVDDVVTTGATLSAASQQLAAAGATLLGAATVAATRRRAAGPTHPARSWVSGAG